MGSQSEDGDRRQSAESNDKMARRLANKAGIYSIFILMLPGELRKRRTTFERLLLPEYISN